MVLLKKHGHEIRRHAFKQTAAVFREQSRDTYLVILQEKENMRQRTGQIKAHFSRQPCSIVYATTSHRDTQTTDAESIGLQISAGREDSRETASVLVDREGSEP